VGSSPTPTAKFFIMDPREKELLLQVKNLQQEVEDLKVVVNTAQTALRSCETALRHDEKKYQEVFVTSAKWVLNYKL
jgi:uncharacterized protein YlxW (UPF0749 family)